MGWWSCSFCFSPRQCDILVWSAPSAFAAVAAVALTVAFAVAVAAAAAAVVVVVVAAVAVCLVNSICVCRALPVASIC